MPMGNLVDFDAEVFDTRYSYSCLRTSRWHNTLYKKLFAAYYLINYAFKVAKLNIIKQYLKPMHQWAKNTIHIYIDHVQIKLYKLRGA